MNHNLIFLPLLLPLFPTPCLPRKTSQLHYCSPPYKYTTEKERKSKDTGATHNHILGSKDCGRQTSPFITDAAAAAATQSQKKVIITPPAAKHKRAEKKILKLQAEH